MAALVLAAPLSAAAVPPDRGSFGGTVTFVDAEVCASEGFAVDVVQTEFGDFRVFFDADGEFTHAIVNFKYTAEISANGKTIHESDSWTEFYYPDWSAMAGNSVHIVGDDGFVQHDAGRVTFNADGTIDDVSGPHPQLLGETFCSALLP